ncbi:MAG: hypothetical protein H6Q90_289 [Deltaproteobacteria bacterium]|nr:hypothetical protein [Deltaproteobacteria bacterium]
MFVQPSRLKTQGAVVAITTGLALGACSDPTAFTDLRPDGPPEVLTVLVMNDSVDLLHEHATFCKTGDDKRPSLVGVSDFTTEQICPEDLSAGVDKIADAVPTDWYVRIMFDELLNTNVEELIPVLDPDTMQPTGQATGSLLNTQPVTLTCNGVVVPYDGYYSPGGNNVTWPLGPSLFIQPIDLSTVPTGADCTVEIKDSVVDKQGNAVPMDQRGSGGTYGFKVSSLAFAGSAPAPAEAGMDEEITADAPLILNFNGFIDPASLADTEITIAEAADCDLARAALTAGTGLKVAAIAADADSAQALDISIVGAPMDEFWNEAKAYAVSFVDGSTVLDVAGGSLTLTATDLSLGDLTLCFTTVAP